MHLLKSVAEVWRFRNLLLTLVWKEIVVRYKQTYLGLAWTLLKPIMLTVVFTLMRSFIGIDSGDVPYAVLTFAALIPWVFFQEGVGLGTTSVVHNAALIRKIYFPREIFPITAVCTKIVEFFLDFSVLLGLMAYYGMTPSLTMLWIPALLVYMVFTVLSINLFSAAMNVYRRDIAHLIPVALSLVMYMSPIIYPLSLVKKSLLVNMSAGPTSPTLYFIYTMNPLVGVIDSFQKIMLHNANPDFSILWPGMITVFCLLPISYAFFKNAEAYFADVI